MMENTSNTVAPIERKQGLPATSTRLQALMKMQAAKEGKFLYLVIERAWIEYLQRNGMDLTNQGLDEILPPTTSL
jgi:hypothetical protein